MRIIALPGSSIFLAWRNLVERHCDILETNGLAGGRPRRAGSLLSLETLSGLKTSSKPLKATIGWKKILGEGSSGKVYRGQLPQPDVPPVDVAIKQLDPESYKGYNKWLI